MRAAQIGTQPCETVEPTTSPRSPIKYLKRPMISGAGARRGGVSAEPRRSRSSVPTSSRSPARAVSPSQSAIVRRSMRWHTISQTASCRPTSQSGWGHGLHFRSRRTASAGGLATARLSGCTPSVACDCPTVRRIVIKASRNHRCSAQAQGATPRARAQRFCAGVIRHLVWQQIHRSDGAPRPLATV